MNPEMGMRSNHLFQVAVISLSVGVLCASTIQSWAKQPESQHLTITVRANWSGCDGNCDNEQSGNLANSGSYTLNIVGSVVPSGGGGEVIIYEPESLTATFTVQSATTTSDKDCLACNPVETVRGTRTVTFGRDENAFATLQAFLGAVGAGFALQLSGELGPGFERSLLSLPERRIISFSGTGPVTLFRTSKDCPSCAPTAESAEAGFAVGINADMAARNSGSASWKSATHPLDALGATVIDLGGPQQLAPERDQQGKAQYTVTWSLGEVEPARLKIRKIFFNYAANRESAVQLKSERDDSDITAPEWTAADVPKPAAFIRDSAFKVKAVFGVEGERIEKAEIWAEEEVVDVEEPSIKKGFGGIKRNTVTFSPGEKEKEVEFTVKTPQPLISANPVKWFWRANVWYAGSDEPEEVEITTEGPGERAATEHTVYIVGGTPVLGSTAYEFLVKKGCQWAQGEQGGDDAFQAIWKSFWDIECPEGTRCGLGSGASGVLAYSHEKSAPYTTIGLLRAGEGRCGAWQDLFADMMGSQGIKVDRYAIHPKSDQYGIVSMVAGRVMAQGNLDPVRNFYDHAVVKYDGKFYDPSYWTVHPSGPGEAISTYEENTFVAYCTTRGQDECVARCNLEAASSRWADSWDIFTECLLRECDCPKNDPFRCEVDIIAE